METVVNTDPPQGLMVQINMA